MKTVIALIAVVAALAGLLVSQLDTGPLPNVRHPNCAVDVLPALDLERIEVGGYEWQAYRTFGRRNLRPPLLDVLEPRRCIAFVYDEALLAGERLALTVMIDRGKVAERWLTPEPFQDEKCAGLPHEMVDLKGHFHAASCWPALWD